jgi:hypothetical protein
VSASRAVVALAIRLHASGEAGARSEDDQRLGPDDLGASAAAAADPVDHLFEVVDVVDSKAYERVWVAGNGERFDQLGQIVQRMVYIGDLGTGREPEFGERLEVAPELGVIEDRGVAADVAGPLKTVDPALGGGRRKADESTDFASRPTAVLHEQVENVVVEGIQSRW